jgi:hypothetical protein
VSAVGGEEVMLDGKAFYDLLGSITVTQLAHYPKPNRILLLVAENSATAENSAAFPAVSTSFSAAYEWTPYCNLSVQRKSPLVFYVTISELPLM